MAHFRILHVVISCFTFLFSLGIKAQMSGAYYVPGSFTSLAAAVASLNSVGINGATTIHVLAGYSETVAIGGLSMTATGTALNPLTIKRDGLGVNPRLIAYSGGTATPLSATQDGIFRLIGCDFVTIDGIDLLDPNTSNPATMEFGYGFFKSSAADGCNNNTVQNCTITLNRINNALGQSPASDGSRGIELANAFFSTHTVAVTPTITSGASSGNRFYGNWIENCNISIALNGYAAATPFLYTDLNNEVGGPLATQGNTLVNFGGGGTAAAAAGIYASVQTHVLIRNNYIISNDGNGLNHAAALRGIYMQGAHSGTASVINNTITLSGGGSTALLHPIENTAGVNTASSNISINNNLIANCSYSAATSGPFRGIYNLGQPTFFSVSNNTFVNNSTAATSGTFAAIFNAGAIAGTANYNNNLINGGIFNANSTSLMYAGIYCPTGSATSHLSISQNTIQNILHTGAVGGTGPGYLLYSSGTCLTETISANIFDGLSIKSSGGLSLILDNHNTPLVSVTNNSVVNGFAKTVAGGQVLCYTNGLNPLPSGTLQLTGNNFSNFTLTAGTAFYGFNNNATGMLFNIDNNVVANVITGNAFSYGIRHFFGNTGSSVSNNLFSNIFVIGGFKAIDVEGIQGLLTVQANTLSGLTSSTGAMYGMEIGAEQPFISRNKISDLAANGSSSTLYGIYLSGGSGPANTARIYNNMIGDLRVNSMSGQTGMMGIYLGSNASFDVAHNTVLLATSSSAANFGSLVVYVNAQLPHTLRSNIFINNSVPSGTLRTLVYYRSNPNLVNLTANSNNNIYYAGTVTPTSNYAVMYDGTSTYPSLNAYQTLMSPRETSSYYENTIFTSTVGSNPGFLHINNTSPSFAESNGLSVTGVSNDIDLETRFGNPGYVGSGMGVDIGADEYNGTLIDLMGPAMSITPFGLVCTTGERTLSATISDISGVASGSLAPRIYFRKNATAYVSSPGVFASGTPSNGVWNFTISAAALGGLNYGDVVSYFIVAQDNIAIPNIISSPFGGLVAASVNSVSSYPVNPASYTVAYLGGVYTVGSAGYFPTLTSAAQAYNSSCLLNAVDFVLLDLTYSAGENFPITFQNNLFANSTNSLAIYPANNVTAVITPVTTTDVAVMRFNDARYIALDGKSSAGRSIRIVNTNSTTSHAGIWLSSSQTGCSNIEIRNLSLTGGSNSITAGSHGIIACSSVSTPLGGSGVDHDFISLSGLQIERYSQGITSVGGSSASIGGNNNWVISNSQIGPVINTTSLNLRSAGILLSNTQLSTITGNTISNVTSNVSQTAYCHGIGMYNGTNSSTISANTISGIIYTGPSTQGASGIDFQVINLNANILVVNNMISDVNSNGGTSFSGGASAGVRVGASGNSGGIRIYNNTIAMTGSTSIPGNSSTGISAALYVASTASNIEVVNSILYSDIQYNFTGTRTYALYSDAAASVFSVMNNNNYITVGSQGVLARAVSGTVNTLPNLQTAFGNNANSQNLPVNFTATNDLHLIPSLNGQIDNLGTPLPGITTDIDGQLRSTSVPDIGADEFTPPNCNSVTASTISVVGTLSVCIGQSVSLTRTPYTTTLPGIQQSWQVGSSLTGPFTPVNGANTNTLIPPSSTPGTYFYVAVNTCSFTNQSSLSNVLTLNVSPFPTVTVNSATTTICAGNVIQLVASGAVSYTWSPASSLSSANGASVNATPGFTTTYLVAGSNPGGCTGTANTASITVNVLPAAGTITVAASPLTVCQGGTVNLQAAATSSVYDVTAIPFSPIPTPTSGVGTLCSNGTQVTSITNGWLDDGNWYVITLPFTFNFFNTNYTGCGISTNGFVTLGSNVPNTFNGYGLALPNFNAGRPSIGAVYGNLSFLNTGTITAFTSGSAPNRRYIINWMNGQFQVSNTGTVTTQVILYETTNVIEVHTSRNTGQYAASQGIQDATGSVAYMAPSRNNQVWSVGSSGDAYRWSPTVTYSWSPSTFLNAVTSSVTAANNLQTSMIYTAIATAVNGCKITGTVGINVNPSPTLSIAGGTVEICAGAALTLTASGAPTYTWSGGPQTSVYSVTPAITTTYVVSGKSATNTCIGSASRIVTVNPLPVLTVSGNSDLCLNQSSTLAVSGADTYSWTNLGTNTIITAASQATGVTVYSVTGTNTLSGCSSATVSTVSVYGFPVLSSSANSIICEGESVTLSASGADTYSWSTGATNSVIVSFPVANSVYTVTGFASPANCSVQSVISVSVLPAPVLAISGLTSFCAGYSSTLLATGANSYTWSTGVQTNSVVVAPSASSVYTVAGTSSANACVGTTSVMVNVLPPPFISIGSFVNTVCPGTPITYTANGAASYTWVGLGQGGSVVTLIPSANSVYTVIGASANNCISQNTVAVFVYPPAVLQLSASQVTVCEGQEFTLTATGVGNIVWNPGNVIGGVLNVPPGVTTTYTVVGRDNNNCEDTQFVTVVVDECSGVEKELLSEAMSVYPNPTSGWVNLSFPTAKPRTLQVMSLTGAVLIEANSFDVLVKLDLSVFAKGMYMIKVDQEQQASFYKIVVD